MTDTPSSILLLRLMSTGSATNLWGGYLNTALQTQERASKGYQALAVTGDATVSWTNYSASNDAAVAFLKLTGSLSSAATLTFPSYQHSLFVWNATGQAVTIKCSGGTGVTIPNGLRTAIYCDGTDYYSSAPNWLNSPQTTLTNAGDVVVKTTLETAIATASLPATSGTVLNSASDTTAGYSGAKTTAKSLGGLVQSTLNSGANEQNQFALDYTNLSATTNVAATDRVGLYDATAGAMRYQTRALLVGKLGLVLQSEQTGNFSPTSGNIYPVNCTSAAITATLPAAVGSYGIIGFIKYGNYPLNLSGTVNGASQTLSLNGEFTETISDSGASRGWI